MRSLEIIFEVITINGNYGGDRIEKRGSLKKGRRNEKKGGLTGREGIGDGDGAGLNMCQRMGEHRTMFSQSPGSVISATPCPRQPLR